MYKEVPIKEITVKHPERTDLGDIDKLADTMSKIGMLHPVGITSNNELVFGHRRLVAAKKAKLEKIWVRMIPDAYVVQARFWENEMRKDLTVSEKTKAGMAFEVYLKSVSDGAVAPAAKARTAAAKQAGFGSEITFRRAKEVVTNGVPELVQAVNDGTIKISRAAQIAKLPPERQRVELLPTVIRETVDDDGVPRDAIGVPLVGKMLKTWKVKEKFEEVLLLMRKASILIDLIASQDGGGALKPLLVCKMEADKKRWRLPDLVNAANTIRFAEPHCCVCPYCQHKHPNAVDPKCTGCHGEGWVTSPVWNSTPQDYREAVSNLKNSKAK